MLKQIPNPENNGETICNNKHRILVIDDNPQIHNDWKQLLEEDKTNIGIEESLDNFNEPLDSVKNSGFEIDSAFQGQEGLDKVKCALRENRPYDMAIVDIRMPPGWDGVTTIKNIWEVCPDLHIVICAFYSDYTWSDIVKRLGKSDKLVMLKYPYNEIEVKQFILGLEDKLGEELSLEIEIALEEMAESIRPSVADTNKWVKGAKNGDVLSMVDLAYAYLYGYGGILQDRGQAIRWLKKASGLGNKCAEKTLDKIGKITISDKYNSMPEWLRWIACFPLSLIIAIICSWSILFINGFLDSDFMRSIIVKVVHPPLCQAIFIISIYFTIPRAKRGFILTFIILRSLIIVMFLFSAFFTLLGIRNIVTFDKNFLLATLGEIIVLVVSVSVWKELKEFEKT